MNDHNAQASSRNYKDAIMKGNYSFALPLSRELQRYISMGVNYTCPPIFTKITKHAITQSKSKVGRPGSSIDLAKPRGQWSIGSTGLHRN